MGRDQQNLEILTKNQQAKSSYNFPSNLEKDFIFQHALNLKEYKAGHQDCHMADTNCSD